MTIKKQDRFSISESLNLHKLGRTLLDASEKIKQLSGESLLTAELENGFMQLQELLGNQVDRQRLTKKIYCIKTDDCYGTIGTYTGYKDYHVGDIVMQGHNASIIVEKDGHFFSYGWRPLSIEEMEKKASLRFKKMKSFDDYTARELNIHQPLTIRTTFG